MFEKSYPVKISLAEVPGNIIINGKRINQKVSCLTCSKCEAVLTTFQNELPDDLVIKWCDDNFDQISNNIKYCLKCGSKLRYPKLIDITDLQ